MLTITIAAVAASAVFIGVLAVALPTRRVSSFSRRTGDDQVLTTSNPLVRWFASRHKVQDIAEGDAQVAELLPETGSEESPLEFYAWRFYNAVLLGGVIALTFALIGVPAALIAGATVAVIITGAGLALGALTGWVTYAMRGPQSLRGSVVKAGLRVNRNSYQLLERVAAGLNAGKGPREAFIATAPFIVDPDVARQVELTVADLNANATFAEAMTGLKNRCDISSKRGVFPVITSFTDMMIAAEKDGTNPAAGFIRQAADLRKQRALVIKERTDKAVMTIGMVGLIGFSPLIIVALLWGVVYGQLVEMGVL